MGLSSITRPVNQSTIYGKSPGLAALLDAGPDAQQLGRLAMATMSMSFVARCQALSFAAVYLSQPDGCQVRSSLARFPARAAQALFYDSINNHQKYATITTINKQSTTTINSNQQQSTISNNSNNQQEPTTRNNNKQHKKTISNNQQ